MFFIVVYIQAIRIVIINIMFHFCIFRISLYLFSFLYLVSICTIMNIVHTTNRAILMLQYSPNKIPIMLPDGY